MKKQKIAALVGLMFAAGTSFAACLDSQLSSSALGGISMSKSKYEIDSSLGCSGEQAGTRTDPLGRKINIYKWQGPHNYIQVDFMEKWGDLSMGKSGSTGFTPPVAGVSADIVFDTTTGVLSIPVLNVNSGIAGASTTGESTTAGTAIGQVFYNVKMELGAGGNWALLSADSQIENHSASAEGEYNAAWKPKASATATYNTELNTLSLPAATWGTHAYNQVGLLLNPGSSWSMLSYTEAGTTTTTSAVPTWSVATTGVVQNYSGGVEGSIFTLADNTAWLLGKDCDFAAPTTGGFPTTVVGSTLTANPTNLAFGNVDVGRKGTSSVTLSSNVAIQLKRILVPSGFKFTNGCNEAIPAGGSCMVTVDFSPTTSTNHAGNMTIQSNAETGSALSIPLTGAGVSPAGTTAGTAVTSYTGTTWAVTPAVEAAPGTPNSVALTAAAVTGMTAVVGQASTVGTITLTAGAVATDVKIKNMSVPAGFSIVNKCGDSLAPSTSCTVDLYFQPTAAQNYAGTFSVGTNAGASIPVLQSLPISGVGTAATTNGTTGASTGYSEWNWTGGGTGAYGAAATTEVSPIPASPIATIYQQSGTSTSIPGVTAPTDIITLQGSSLSCPVTKIR